MHVAYLINQYPKVSHSFIRREIRALEELGWVVDRVALRGWSESLADPDDVAERSRTRYLLQRGVPYLLGCVLQSVIGRPAACWRALRVTLKMAFGRSDRTWVQHAAALAEACALWRLIQHSGIAHIHAHFGTNSAEVAMLAHLISDTPYSFTVHGPEEFDRPEALHLGLKARHARFVIAVSSYGRSQLYRWLPHEDWRKVQVVHCGLEPGFWGGTVHPFPQAARLVCVGRLCEQKGQLLLLEAARVLMSRARCFELVLAGDGEMRELLEAYIHRHGLQGHVRITGWIGAAQVREELLAARALVLPSFAEGLPVVIMEAMALCRPVLTTYVAGIPELVVHGETGWLFPAGDIDALVDAMEAVLRASLDRLQSMGERGRQRASLLHDVNVEAWRLARCMSGDSP